MTVDVKHKPSAAASPAFVAEVGREELSIIGHAKRFVERYSVDPVFRAKLGGDARAVAGEYGIKIDPEEIRPLWDREAAGRYARKELPVSPAVELCYRYDRALVGWMMRRRTSDAIAHPGFRAWWERQLARNDGEIGTPFNAKDVHAPVCIELSAGCTVSCWFCAISAERFHGYFAYTPENARLWREVLQVIRDIIGPAAEVGFCYWATDPLDNPDYEKLITDYHDVVGSLPPTTTAQPHKHIERIRRLLRMWEDFNFVYNRFSILTPKILDRVHQEFSAEELVWTGLEPLNKESTKKKATAGRALEKLRKIQDGSETLADIEDELTQGTIACVSGFLFNMVEKKVKLISPCRADDRWPDGYRIYAECTFTDAADLREKMLRMIDDHMPAKLRAGDKLRFRRDLGYRTLPDGFELSTKFLKLNVQNAHYGRKIGDLIQAGAHTLDEIVKSCAATGVMASEIEASIDMLFRNGLMDDEPPVPAKPVEFKAQAKS